MPLEYLPIFAEHPRPGGPRVLARPSRVAWQPLAVPLARARVALLSTAALRHAGQPPFSPPDDTSVRLIVPDPAVADLQLDHRSPVGADARRDPEVILPRAALRSLAARGVVGSVARQHLSCVGASEQHRAVEAELGPALARELAGDGVDLAVLVPY